jgi:hypothetical protein
MVIEQCLWGSGEILVLPSLSIMPEKFSPVEDDEPLGWGENSGGMARFMVHGSKLTVRGSRP